MLYRNGLYSVPTYSDIPSYLSSSSLNILEIELSSDDAENASKLDSSIALLVAFNLMMKNNAQLLSLTDWKDPLMGQFKIK